MPMKRWLTSLRDRPIAESERSAAMATVTVLLIAVAILLALTQPGGPPRLTLQEHPAASIVQRAPSLPARAPEGVTASLTPRVARAADLFLDGYLGYLYGHTPASRVKGATPRLARSLQADPPRVSSVMRAREAHVLALHTVPAPSGLVGVSALVNDGGLVDYQIGLLLLAPRDGRLLVSGLEGSG
jgi:hypothetical protein